MGTGKTIISLRLAALALFLASLFAFAAAPTPALAQAAEITQDEFDARVDAVEEEQPVYGPEDGELPHDPEVATVALSGLELSDLVATATFTNPYAASRQQFDYGIQFRSAGVDDDVTYLRFIVLSTGDWAITSGAGDILVNDTYRDLEVGRNDENTLTVIVEGSIVHAAINGDYVGSVEVELTGAGDVAPGTAFFGDSFRDGAVTRYSEFTVWAIGESADDQAASNGRTNRPNTGIPKPPGGASGSAGDDRDNDRAEEQTETSDVVLTEHVTQGEEGRLVYLSPTFGFTVEILPGWTIEEDSVQNGYDTLVVASPSGRVTVSGFASTGTAVRCIDSIIANISADPNLSNVEIGVQPDGSTSRWDSETTSEVVIFFTADGTNYVRYYACFSGNDGQSMLVFAYEALEEEIETEFAKIEEMLDLIRVP